MKTVDRTLVIAALLSLLTACAATPKHANYRPVPAGSTLAIESPAKIVEATDVASTGESARRGAAAVSLQGAGAGIYTGLSTSVMCGPLIIYCGPVLALFGAGAGAIAGGIIGTVDGSLKGVPAEHAVAIETSLKEHFARQSPDQRLHAHFAADAGRRVSLVENGDHQLLLSFDKISVQQNGSKRVRFTVQASAVLRYPDSDLPSKTVRFTEATSEQSTEYWMEQQGASLIAEVDGATQRVARRMADFLIQ